MTHTLFCCHQCWAAVNEPDPRYGPEPDGLCAAGFGLYVAVAHDAGEAMRTGQWARFDATSDAYRAHVVGVDVALTSPGVPGILAAIENAAMPGRGGTRSGHLAGDLSTPGGQHA
jgi:hypothetical protein